MQSTSAIRYDHLTWPEIKAKVVEQPVVVVPVGVIEDHGYHLPVDTDNLLVTRICEAAAEKAPKDILLMPSILYGFSPHHMDFPGTISIEADHFVHYILDVTKSVAYHGFRRIILVNGHGSNAPCLNLVARRTILETDAICAAINHWNLAPDVVSELRESDVPGGICHACELETSLYLFLCPERVQRDKIQKEIKMPKGKFIWYDLVNPPPAHLTLWWSQVTETGVVGDPTYASVEKGRRIFEACVEGLVEFSREFKSLEIGSRVDHH
jgi:creatinine amidohydrolase